MSFFNLFLLAILFFTANVSLFGVSAGNTSASFDSALSSVNVAGGTIEFDVGDVNLTDQVRAVQTNPSFIVVPNITITIEGMGNNLDGSSTTRGVFVGGSIADGTGSCMIKDLNFTHCRAKGGNGGISGGGGGFGAGGALFVGLGMNATLQDCTFSNCSAKGGNGAAIVGGVTGGGGGGMRGNGGDGDTGGGGGGGFGGNGATGTPIGGGGGGASGFSAGNAVSTTAGKDFDGMGTSSDSGVGGDGGAIDTMGDSAGFGGGGGGGGPAVVLTPPGGTGEFGGGGGGATSALFASGGLSIFGGGGGGSTGDNSSGGNSFFGGGGGGAGGPNGNGGFAGFGGGNGDGNSGFGGKGGGFGGAIYIQPISTLTIITTSNFNGPMFSGNSASAGDIGNPSTIPFANGGALGQDILLSAGGLLTFDLSTPVSMPNPIEGDFGAGGGNVTANSLTKQGTALLTLNGTNTYTGTTTVASGELRIVGSVNSAIVVQPGATLSGNFTAAVDGFNPNSGNITNSGKIIPGTLGDGAGQIFIEGNFTNEATGTLTIDITPTGNINDKIFMTGNAILNGGQLEVFVGAGNYLAGTQYEVILGTVTGAFANQANPTQIGPGAGKVQIGVTTGSLILTILGNALFVDKIIDPGVPQDVANCIIAATIVPGSDFANVVEILGTLSDPALNRALFSLSAVRYGSLEWINARNNSYIAEILSQHLFELCCSPRTCCECESNISAWVSVFGNFMNNKKQLDNLQKFDANAGGALIGIDFCATPCFYYGAAFSYTYTDFCWKGHGGRGTINSYSGALYGSIVWNCFNGEMSFLGGGSDNDTKRKIDFSTVKRTAKGDFWSYFFTAHLGLRPQWRFGCAAWEPFVLGDYHYYTHKTFTEKGADSLNLLVKSKSQNMMRGEAGLRWYYEVDCGCYCYAPYLGASWVGEFPLNKSKQPASFTGQSCVINATSYDSAVQFGSVQAGIKRTHCNGLSGLLGYKGLFSKTAYINEIEGRLEWIF